MPPGVNSRRIRTGRQVPDKVSHAPTRALCLLSHPTNTAGGTSALPGLQRPHTTHRAGPAIKNTAGHHASPSHSKIGLPRACRPRCQACSPPPTDTGARRETTASTRVVAPPLWGLSKPSNAPSRCNPNHTDCKLRLLQGISTYTHAQPTIIPFLRTSRANPSSTAQRPVLGLTVTYAGKVG